MRCRVSACPIAFSQTCFPSARLSAMTTLVVALAPLEKHATAADRHGAVSPAEPGRRPDHAGAAAGPFREEPGFLGHAVAVGSLPLRPVGGRMNGCRTQEGGKNERERLCHQCSYRFADSVRR